MKLEGPSRLCFLSWDMDRAVVVLAVAVVLVSSGGAPDLVELGSAAMCWGVLPVFPKNCAVIRDGAGNFSLGGPNEGYRTWKGP